VSQLAGAEKLPGQKKFWRIGKPDVPISPRCTPALLLPTATSAAPTSSRTHRRRYCRSDHFLYGHRLAEATIKPANEVLINAVILQSIMHNQYTNNQNLAPANTPGIHLPGQAIPCWYFEELQKNVISPDRILQMNTDEYFMITDRNISQGILVGYLGRVGAGTPFFQDRRRGLSYFNDYYDGKAGYFTFDGKTVYQLDQIQPGKPLLFILKQRDMEENNSAKQVHHTTIQGNNNIVTSGSNNSARVEQHGWTGNTEKFKEELTRHRVPAEDIQEIAEIVQHEQPDPASGIPTKATNWINKMLGKALSGAWEITTHTAGALLAEIIKSYYGLRG
jgi:hypothetical protein